MFCNRCGKEIPNNAKFCPGCGKNLELVEAENDSKDSMGVKSEETQICDTDIFERKLIQKKKGGPSSIYSSRVIVNYFCIDTWRNCCL